MKNIFLVIILLITIGLKAQSQTLPWDENGVTYLPGLDQIGGKNIVVIVKNRGSSVDNCNLKAKQQALFQLIFLGISVGANGYSGSQKIADMSDYKQKKTEFDSYITNDAVKYISDASVYSKYPVNKIDKKTYEVYTLVTIQKLDLIKDLTGRKLVRSAADIVSSLGYKPSILIVPSDEWMTRKSFFKVVQSDVGKLKIYNYEDAIVELKEFKQISTKIKARYDDVFDIKELSSLMQNIATDKATNNMQNLKTQESELDLIARVVNANLWIKIDLVKESVNNGTQTQYSVSCNGIDPYTGSSVINGDVHPLITNGDNFSDLINGVVVKAMDELSPRIFDYFLKRETSGINGSIEFKFSQELADQGISFNSDIEIEGDTYDMGEVITSMINKFSIERKLDGATDAYIRKYDVHIPTKVEDKLSGKVVSNDFEKFSKKVKQQIEKEYGYKAQVISAGLGKVTVIFIEKK